ncbi:MAG: porin [Betaproteobacteria bacterium]|nr:porin [Betaproteobacteria bacterium]
MKKSLLALAALASVASVAHAEQDGVQLYGILDVGIATQNNSKSGSDQFPVTIDNNSAANSLPSKTFTGMVNGPMSDSRWGIKGSENLGNGLSAHFVLESGINLPTGQLNNAANSQAIGTNSSKYNAIANADSSLSGQLFNRTAHVGVTSVDYGTLDLGRNYTPGFDVIGAYDPQTGSQLFSPLGFSGSQGGALGYTEMLRNDNSVKYTNKFNTGMLNGINVGAIYKFGNTSGNIAAGSGYGVNVGYEPSSRFGVQGVWQAYHDVAATSGATYSASNPAGVAATLYDTVGYMITTHYKFVPKLDVKAGYEWYSRQNANDTAASIGSVSEFGYVFVSGTNLTSYSGPSKVWRIPFIGADYAVKDNLHARVAYYDLQQDAVGATGAIRQNLYSAVLDYNFTKRTDVYTGVMYQSLSGDNLAYGTGNTSATTLAVGMRHKF